MLFIHAPFYLTCVYTNKMTLGGPLDNFRMAAGPRGTNVVRELKVSVLPPKGVGGGLEIVFHHQWSKI